MASVEDRWTREVDGQRVRSDRHGVGKRWVVRYRDPAGKQRHAGFDRKIDADRFRATVEADVLRGSYVDPSLGKITVRDFAEDWLAAQTFDASTREATEHRLNKHVLPHLGDYQLAVLKPSHVQAWIRGLQQSLSPRYVRVITANLSAVLGAAVDDERIPKNPCRAASIRLPRLDTTKVEPWTVEQVQAVHAALPDRYRIMATLGAGCGMRQGEIFGLAVDDVDFLRGVVRVVRQVKIVGNRVVFALPKGRRTREVPLPKSVTLELAAHLQRLPALRVELPWETPAGDPTAAALILTSREAAALNRNYINAKVWKPALTQAKVPATRDNGMHALRHFCASAWLDGGVNIRAVSEYLGHSDPGFTLRVYTHLMPAAEDRAREAIDRALRREDAVDASTSCAPDVRQDSA